MMKSVNLDSWFTPLTNLLITVFISMVALNSSCIPAEGIADVDDAITPTIIIGTPTVNASETVVIEGDATPSPEFTSAPNTSPSPSKTLAVTNTPTHEFEHRNPIISLENLNKLREIFSTALRQPFLYEGSFIGWSTNSENYAYVDSTRVNIFHVGTNEIENFLPSQGPFQFAFTSKFLLTPNGSKIKVWDAVTYAYIGDIRSIECGGIGNVVISPNEEYMVTGYTVGGVRDSPISSLYLWSNNECIATILYKTAGTVRAYGFNFDSSLFQYHLDEEVVIIDVANRSEVCRIEGFWGKFNPTENTILIGSLNGMSTWEPISCTKLMDLEDYPFRAFSEISPDGKLLLGTAEIVIADENNVISDILGWRLVAWDMESGKVVYTSGEFPGILWGLDVSPDGRYILAGTFRKEDTPDMIRLFAIEE